MQHSDRHAPSEAKRRVSDQLSDLAYRIRRLCPDHRDPHRFHEEKSEIAHDLRTLAQHL